jgi:Skp family chaperone for outer membrane proteins
MSKTVTLALGRREAHAPVTFADLEAVANKQYEKLDDRFNLHETTLNLMNNKIDALEKKVDKKIDALEEKMKGEVNALKEDHEERFDRLGERFDRLEERFDYIQGQLNNSQAIQRNSKRFKLYHRIEVVQAWKYDKDVGRCRWTTAPYFPKHLKALRDMGNHAKGQWTSKEMTDLSSSQRKFMNLTTSFTTSFRLTND